MSKLHPKQEEILNKVIKLLENNNLEWLKSWSNGNYKSFITKKDYRGINMFMLKMHSLENHFSSNYYLTFLQIKKLKASLKKGSKACPIFYYQLLERERENEDTGEVERTKYPILKVYSVFNLEQTDIKVEEEVKNDLKPVEKCENVVSNYKNKPKIEQGLNPCYSPKDDIVYIPEIKSFLGVEEYYSTLYHELSHSTGHESRLKRDGVITVNSFKSKEYSKEEVIAELGACFLCGAVGIDNKTINNSSAYIQSWIKNLREDKHFLFKVMSEAQKSTDCILNSKQEKSVKESN
jgi:antirestriction protein ArdC